MAELEILILDKLQARMAPGRIYEPDELTAAGLSLDPDGGPNDGWHLRIPVRRVYASREDIANYATRAYPGVPVMSIPAAELEKLRKEHLDYGTYIRRYGTEKVDFSGNPVMTGKLDGRTFAAMKRSGKLSDCPGLEQALERALETCRERRGAAVFVRDAGKK